MTKILPRGKLSAAKLTTLLQKLPKTRDEVILAPGVGRDAAGLRLGGQLVAITTDPITLATDRIATYSLAANINDIACLGCKPRWYTATLLLPTNITESRLDNIWEDLTQQLEHYDIQCIGGHTEITDAVNRPVIVGQLIGEAIGNTIVDPRNCQAGDRILLWQKLAIEGTALIAYERYNDLSKYIDKKHLDVMSKLLDNPGICVWPFVKKLLPNPHVVALHDPTEGGLATALHELAEASNCGLVIGRSAIPILPETKTLTDLLNLDPLGLLASGSLILVCRPEAEYEILEQMSDEPIVTIGHFTEKTDRIFMHNGQASELPYYPADEVIKGLNVAI